MDSALDPRFKTPTFDPRGAFARTLRGGEIARLARAQEQNERRVAERKVRRMSRALSLVGLAARASSRP
jgi:hypothetical protein